MDMLKMKNWVVSISLDAPGRTKGLSLGKFMLLLTFLDIRNHLPAWL